MTGLEDTDDTATPGRTTQADEIQWPDEHAPDRSRIHVSNDLFIEGVSPETIWAHLIRAEQWPEWYDNCTNLRFEDPFDGPDLEPGTRFRWWTFGVPVRTQVEEFEPPYRLAWSGRGLGSRGYHAWLIDPQPNGCHVLTEETQRGLIPFLAGWYLRPKMLTWHQRWLEGLADQATDGMPVEP